MGDDLRTRAIGANEAVLFDAVWNLWLARFARGSERREEFIRFEGKRVV